MKRGHDLSGIMKFATGPPGPSTYAMRWAAISGTRWMSSSSSSRPTSCRHHRRPLGGGLVGCAFEDLLTREVEAGPNKLYMRALRSSVMSLYEVSEVEPGNGFLVRDLIRGGEPVRVSERSASQTLKAWDKIGARVVTVGGKQLLSGGVLSFTMEAADALMAGLARAEGKRGPRAKLALDDEKLRGLASLVSTAWLFDVVPRAMGTVTPTLHNSDGEEVVFHRVRVPFARGGTQAAVAERPDTAVPLQRENDRFWNWLGTKPSPGRAGAPAISPGA